MIEKLWGGKAGCSYRFPFSVNL